MKNEDDEWNEVEEEQEHVDMSVNKLWRKQFLKNPFRLGVYGMLMLFIWIAFSAYWIYRTYMGQSELVRAGYFTSGSNDSGATLSAAIMFVILWGFTLITSPFFAKRTVQRFEKKGKNFEEIIKRD